MEFHDQLERIKLALKNLKKLDRGLKIFGADNHQYKFHPPVSVEKVKEFEVDYNVSLPDDYVAFITAIGNGGPGNYGGAGPYYGIYPLSDFGYMPTDEGSMSSTPVINSALTQNKWEHMIEFEEKLDHDSVQYDLNYKALFDGLMSIGTMGCNGQMMLVLNGKDRGRVVYIDQDLYLPTFPPFKNFLDWYENWVEKSIASLTEVGKDS